MSIETVLLIGAALVLLSLFITKAVDNIGLPSLLLFLGVGMAFGPEGLKVLSFSDPSIARSLGIVALVFILFSGGLETEWRHVRGIMREGVLLATLGVLITAALAALFAWKILGFSPPVSLLIGAIIASTDAAAVFAILRGQSLQLRGGLRPLIELESGTNDPMAIFLTVSMIALIQEGELQWWVVLISFLRQMLLGAVVGLAAGWLMGHLVNRLRFRNEGLGAVFTLAFAFFLFGLTDKLEGSGFLAVYLAGIMLGNSTVLQKKTLVRFWDSLAWLSQIAMFVTLGIFVLPSQLKLILVQGLLLSAALVFIARPAAVYLSLSLSRMGLREKTFVAWVGIRGAVPIILATFPLTQGIPGAQMVFHIVFFVVLTSALLQGWTLPLAARVLGVSSKGDASRKSPIEAIGAEGFDGEIADFILPFNSAWAAMPIVEIPLPEEALILLVCRNGKYLVPGGATSLEDLDVITVLHRKKDAEALQEIMARSKPPA